MKKCAIIVALLCCGSSLHAADLNQQKPFFDFFRILIEPPQPPKRKAVAKQVIQQKPQVQIPPLQVNIMGISGEEGARIAILTYKGKQMLVEEGTEEAGEFKVIRIDENKITFLHIKAGKRQEVPF